MASVFLFRWLSLRNPGVVVKGSNEFNESNESEEEGRGVFVSRDSEAEKGIKGEELGSTVPTLVKA
jgi:hypothetical protein